MKYAQTEPLDAGDIRKPAFNIDLRDMPNLKLLRFPFLVRSLHLENLPRLTALTADEEFAWALRRPFDLFYKHFWRAEANAISAESLFIKDLPLLKHLAVSLSGDIDFTLLNTSALKKFELTGTQDPRAKKLVRRSAPKSLIEKIAACRDLTHLTLAGVDIPAGGVSAWKRLTNLEELRPTSVGVDQRDLNDIGQFPKLSCLEITPSL